MRNLSERARALRNAYQREWKRRNPDMVRKHQADYWERKAAQMTTEQQARELQIRGYTQREISDLLEISLGTVNKYLKNE